MNSLKDNRSRMNEIVDVEDMLDKSPEEYLAAQRRDGSALVLIFNDGEENYAQGITDETLEKLQYRGRPNLTTIFMAVAKSYGLNDGEITLTDCYDLRGDEDQRLAGFKPKKIINGKMMYEM